MSEPDQDPLTRLHHESVLRERLPRELLRAKSYEHPLSLLRIRVEVPGELRAVLFYPLLKTVAKRVRESVRAIDLAVRLEDDVALMLAETPAAGALRLGEKLTELVESSAYTAGLSGTPVRPGLRIAVATFPEDGDDERTLLEVLARRLEDAPAEPTPAPSEP